MIIKGIKIALICFTIKIRLMARFTVNLFLTNISVNYMIFYDINYMINFEYNLKLVHSKNSLNNLASLHLVW